MLGQKLIFKQDRNRRGGGNAGGGSILSIPLFIIIALQVDLKRSQNSKQLQFQPQTPANHSVDPYKQSMGQELLMVVQNSLVLWIPRANQSQWSEKQFQLSYSTILIPGQGQAPISKSIVYNFLGMYVCPELKLRSTLNDPNNHRCLGLRGLLLRS